MTKKKERPRLINGKVTDGYIGDSLFIVEKQPSKETLEYLNNFFISQVRRYEEECI